ncbi:hypothetical protein FC99_GL001568 [Levilactobacillus koreensis JCM 16448]|uniref:Uncharacterized protein n=1 Tax=Levilactobacillus koreensis TaxID=637971 RepID=A0AAC8UU89_9LACO|nr:hypothetical protein [Levilactobacillus koreensis]AKP63998.1 hypothetical protein ABN16_02630 [Levilactobacillus koreensis]KRK86405.1 hypothetical protein FC99_GL001568 [Levilactobacillus koreensis JCM 16448]
MGIKFCKHFYGTFSFWLGLFLFLPAAKWLMVYPHEDLGDFTINIIAIVWGLIAMLRALIQAKDAD